MSYADQHYQFAKVVLFVTPSAAALTTVTVESPSTVRLFYTTAARWMTGPSDAEIATRARSSVTVGRCADRLAGYAGGILLPGPVCVRLRIAGTDVQRRAVSFGGATCG